jgi:hypothetical protein
MSFGQGIALPEEVERKLEVRAWLMALELSVDPFSSDWLDVTARKFLMRMLSGQIMPLRLLLARVGGRNTLKVIRRGGPRPRFSKAKLEAADSPSSDT